VCDIGARFYYLRRIFHDYPDEKCITILQNLLPALGSGSQILIDEMVLPDSYVPWQATMTDLSMMMSLGGKERTREQWTKMIEGAGFQTLQIYTYGQTLYQSIIVVGLK
jgi:demethylsterigmatocystin 6-O-methyltransferase